MKISRINCNFEREPLAAPFGFKGGYLNEIWQAIVKLEGDNGTSGIGLGSQSTLWSDASIFCSYPESTGNSMMYMISSFAAKKLCDLEWTDPISMLDAVLPETYEYAKKITGNNELRLTFALNALVAVDNAIWQLYCLDKGIKTFDEMVPEDIRPSLATKHEKLAAIPLMSYGVSMEDIIKAVDEGCFFMKIKVGSDPEKDGDLDKMLEWDKQRLSDIHDAVKDRGTPYTENGKIPYYLDANGRYDSKERLMRLLDHADKIGALERIMIMEEPFPEEYKVDVSDIPVRLAADESAHSDKDALERIELGYGAIALKPIAKTMSMSLKIAKLAYERNVPCFCADLTVNPILVDWNKNVASRLKALPGMNIGVLETNGHQNYKNWETMQSYHPCPGSSWQKVEDGVFNLGEDFYKSSGGIFEQSEHYMSLVK